MEKLKVGILGLGRGRAHLKNLIRIPEVDVVGAADFYDPVIKQAMECIE